MDSTASLTIEPMNTARLAQDNPARIASAIALGTIGTMIFLVLPGLLGSIVDGTQITVQQAGIVIAGDLLGLGIAIALLSFYTHRLNWRFIAVLGLSIVVSGNLLCTQFDTFAPVFIIRFIVGMGEGMLTALMYALLGQTSNPDRNFALYLVVEMIFGALYLWFIPDLALQIGVHIAYIALAVLSVAGFGFLAHIPAGKTENSASGNQDAGGNRGVMGWAVLGLAANFCFFAGLCATWGYIDRIGVAADIDVATIGKALSFSLMGSLTGAGISAIAGVRFGRAFPITLGVLVCACCLWVLSSGFGLLSYFLVVYFYCLGWSGCHPYLTGFMSTFRGSTLVVATAAAQTLGMGTGPMLGALAVTEVDFTGAYLISFGLLLAAYLAMMLLCKKLAAKREPVSPAVL